MGLNNLNPELKKRHILLFVVKYDSNYYKFNTSFIFLICAFEISEKTAQLLFLLIEINLLSILTNWPRVTFYRVGSFQYGR